MISDDKSRLLITGRSSHVDRIIR